MTGPLRPVRVCRALLDALEATEGRRRRRKRNTSADSIGIGMKRELLEGALRDDPDPDAFEGWLLERCFEKGAGEGAWRAMALDIFYEWRMAEAAPSFREWLEAGAPSDDKTGDARPRRGPIPTAGSEVRQPGTRESAAQQPGPGRSGLPILLLALVLGAVGCGDAPDYGGEVPTIDVAAMDEDDRQRTGMRAFVLSHMRAGPGPDSTIYDPAVDLARPDGAARWPPRTGTHGDEAIGALPDEPEAGAAPDTAGGGSGESNLPEQDDATGGGTGTGGATSGATSGD